MKQTKKKHGNTDEMAAESWLTSNLIKEALQREWGSNRNQEAKERSQGSLDFVNLGYGIFTMELSWFQAWHNSITCI